MIGYDYTRFEVTLTTGMTLDGLIATATKESKEIISDAAKEDAHTLRYQQDTLLNRKHTILHDNPSLTTQRPRGGHHPIRIVHQSEHILSHTLNGFQTDQAPIWVYTTNYANEQKCVLDAQKLTLLQVEPLGPDIKTTVKPLKKEAK